MRTPYDAIVWSLESGGFSPPVYAAERRSDTERLGMPREALGEAMSDALLIGWGRVPAAAPVMTYDD